MEDTDISGLNFTRVNEWYDFLVLVALIGVFYFRTSLRLGEGELREFKEKLKRLKIKSPE